MNDDVQQAVQVTKQTLIQAIEGILGNDGAKLSDKVSNAPDTADGLKTAIQQCEKITRLTFDKEKYSNLQTVCSALIADLDSVVNAVVKDDDAIQQERKIRMAKAKLITIASKILGNGADGIKITGKLREAPESIDGLRGSLKECTKLASLTTDADKVRAMNVHCEKILQELE